MTGSIETKIPLTRFAQSFATRFSRLVNGPIYIKSPGDSFGGFEFTSLNITIMCIHLRGQAERFPPTNLLLRQKSSGRFRIDRFNKLLATVVLELDFSWLLFHSTLGTKLPATLFASGKYGLVRFNPFAAAKRGTFNFIYPIAIYELQFGRFFY